MIRKIAVIGNAGGGKTKLSRGLHKLYSLPLVHVDSLQFIPPMAIRPYQDTIGILRPLQNSEEWIIDGYGPLDLLHERLALADCVVFIDLPLVQHYWWFAKRQLVNLWSPRQELPEGCSELSWSHTLKVIKSMWKAHQQMRPELLRILARPELQNKVVHIQTFKHWQNIFNNGLPKD